MQQHQREQPVHLGLVGHQLGERPPEPDRLGREIAAAAVALVEDQVDDREHGREPVGQQVVGRHPERDPGGLDLPLGAHEPLRHRRLGRRGTRGRSRRSSSPPSVRSVSATCASIASAGWQQVKISSSRSSGNVVSSIVSSTASGTSSSRVFAASVRSRRIRLIARLRAVVISHAPGLSGIAVARPALGGDRERLLRGLLGEVEVAEEADQGSEDAAPLLAEDLLEDGLPLHDRAHLDRAAHPRRRDPGGQLDRGVEVVGLEEQVAADRLLDLDERAVGRQRPAVLHPDGRRRLGCCIWTSPGVTPASALIAW